jgi:hypothetical protein
LTTPQTESTPLPCFSPSVTSKKIETKNDKKENERERIEPENKQKKERRKDTKWLSHLGRFKHNLMINPTGRRVPDLSMRDDGGGKLVGERRWLPDYHNQDGVAP